MFDSGFDAQYRPGQTGKGKAQIKRLHSRAGTSFPVPQFPAFGFYVSSLSRALPPEDVSARLRLLPKPRRLRFLPANRLIQPEKRCYALNVNTLAIAGKVLSLPRSSQLAKTPSLIATWECDPAFSGRVKGVTVYEPEIRSFAEGDRVQFTTPWREKAISTRDMGTVSYLDDKGNIRVRLDGSDQTVDWNLNDGSLGGGCVSTLLALTASP